VWNFSDKARRRRCVALVCGGAGVAALLATAFVPAVSAGAAAAVAGGAAAVAAAAQTATIQIANFKFGPPDLTVAAGTKVTWKNADDSPHRVADRNGAYTSPALDTDDSFSHTFATPGVYKYFCSLHPYMVGTIVVK
jgi:plastocyanin